jgi:hypothetical protein
MMAPTIHSIAAQRSNHAAETWSGIFVFKWVEK